MSLRFYPIGPEMVAFWNSMILRRRSLVWATAEPIEADERAQMVNRRRGACVCVLLPYLAFDYGDAD